MFVILRRDKRLLESICEVFFEEGSCHRCLFVCAATHRCWGHRISEVVIVDEEQEEIESRRGGGGGEELLFCWRSLLGEEE